MPQTVPTHRPDRQRQLMADLIGSRAGDVTSGVEGSDKSMAAADEMTDSSGPTTCALVVGVEGSQRTDLPGAGSSAQPVNQ